MYFLPTGSIHLGSQDLDDIGGYDGTHLSAFGQVFSFDQTGHEPRCPHVTGTVGIKDVGLHRRDGHHFIAALDVSSFGSNFHHGYLATRSDEIQGLA